jgi:hypothetical protein
MPSDETNVTIVSWPKEPVTVEHHTAPEEPCAVSIAFAETPARVIVATDPKQPVSVDMKMQVTAREPVPICIKLCEPICAKSDYTIGINIFDNPFASINIRGMTRLYNCHEQPDPVPERVCTGFDKLEVGSVFTEPFVHEGLTFSPLGEQVRAATFGEPAGRIKLAFPREGLRVDFSQPVEDVLLTINNYASPQLTITAYAGSAVLTQFPVTIDGTVRDVTISETGITALTITGGDNEAGLVQVCRREVIYQKLVAARALG